MSGSSRGQFASSFGFVMAATGSAVGLGNIWAFPTQTAQNGGAAFVILYLILAFVVGYPVLLAEFIVGRCAQSNPVGAYQKIKGGRPMIPAGYMGMIAAGLILSFYSLIAGSMIAYFIEPFFRFFEAYDMAAWMISQSTYSRVLFSSLFFFLTILIVGSGINNGIEKWSVRLMPTLLIIMVILIGYVLTLEGALEGVKKYLLPDFTKVFDSELFLSAMGQAFFSLSLGVGTMMVYASYVDKKENLPRLGILVTLCDVGVAFLAGMLIIPAMYVASASGMPIFDQAGNLISGPNLIFNILPALFNTMGPVGIGVALVFFFLMTIASLTSTISMLELPVSYAIDNRHVNRQKASIIVGLMCWIMSMLIAFNFDLLFELVVTLTTRYLQPILGLLVALFVGWAMDRDMLIQEIQRNNPNMKNSLFMKIWPFFIRVISPILILMVFLHSSFFS